MKHIVKRFFPSSLIGQLLVLVAVTLLIAQTLNAVLLYRANQFQNRLEAATFGVGRIANDIERMNERERRFGREPARRSRRSRVLVTDDSVVKPDMKRLPAFEVRALEAFGNMGADIDLVQVAMVQELPLEIQGNVVGLREIRRRVRESGYDRRGSNRRGNRNGDTNSRDISEYIIISVKANDGRWISIASGIAARNDALTTTLILQTLVLYIILLVPLLLLGRYISRPLKILTKSAASFKPGEVVNIEESGPPDTRNLIAAFNDMSSRVGVMLNEKDVMLGAIGHDLRTPLAALRVRVESVDDATERDRMIAGIEDMDRTLDDILSLARLGRSKEETRLTDIAALIETVVDEFTDIGEKVEFTRLTRIAAKVRATLIRRALRNLISNAVKYGDHALVTVELAAVDTSEDGLLIHVDDQGPGLSEEKMEAMFEPFARAEASRNRATGGSGLGLTLARAIARDHGGDVTLFNRKEGGLRATLFLPTQSD